MKLASKVPVLILAGGLGTRLSEETHLKPKPMVEIGGIPLLVHLMRYYYKFGFNDFVVLAGYRSWEIKNYFLNYEAKLNHLEIDHRINLSESPRTFGANTGQEHWRVRVLDTGLDAMTGSRVAQGLDLLQSESFEDFALTYGDGLGNIHLAQALNFHMEHGQVGTVTGVNFPARFGQLKVVEGKVEGFIEKPQMDHEVVSGGFFFFKRAFREYVSAEKSCVMEKKPMEDLARDGKLMTHIHRGFWQPMDTLRDKMYLENLLESGNPPWLSPAP